MSDIGAIESKPQARRKRENRVLIFRHQAAGVFRKSVSSGSEVFLGGLATVPSVAGSEGVDFLLDDSGSVEIDVVEELVEPVVEEVSQAFVGDSLVEDSACDVGGVGMVAENDCDFSIGDVEPAFCPGKFRG